MALATFYFTKWLRISVLFVLLSCAHEAHTLVYFFDPQCGHCEAVARQMAGWQWGTTKIVAVPVSEPRFAPDFLRATGLAARIDDDPDLRRQHPFRIPPHAVLLRGHRTIRSFSYDQFEGGRFRDALVGEGFIAGPR